MGTRHGHSARFSGGSTHNGPRGRGNCPVAPYLSRLSRAEEKVARGQELAIYGRCYPVSPDTILFAEFA